MRIPPELKLALGIAAAAAMLGHSAAFAQAAAGTGQPPAGTTTTTTTTAPAGKPLAKADQKILSDLANGNMVEIELAKLADSKSQNDQVKTFARQMIDDHTKALTDIGQLATARGVTLPSAIDTKHKAAADKLAALSGDAFDKAYLKQAGVADHKQMHSMLTAAHKKAKDPELKALVARIQPTVEQHLKAAQQMKLGKADAKKDTMPTATVSGK